MLFPRRVEPFPARRSSGATPLAEGGKTRIWEFERGDVDRWVAWPHHTDPLFESYNPPVLTERQRTMYYQQYRNAAGAKQYAVEDREGRLVGRISLRDADWKAGISVLGISFHPQMLGQGLGQDALWSFLGYYFGPLRMSVLLLDVAAFNTRARRVYDKCGFQPRGQRWGDPQIDHAGIFRMPERRELRALFHWEHGLVRPLLVDMVLRKEEWERLRDERAVRVLPNPPIEARVTSRRSV